MTPVLLDQTGLFKAGISLTLMLVGVFVGGYYLGHQNAESGTGMDLNQTMVLALPKPAHAHVSEFEPYVPEAEMPGADIDVDRPGLATEDSDNHEYTELRLARADTDIASVIEQTTNAIEVPVIVDVPVDQADRQRQLALAMPTDGVHADPTIITPIDRPERSAGSDQPTAANSDSAPWTAIVDSASVGDARYTIQVGVFADADNAMRRQKELRALQLTAYVNEYRNKSDQPRFNVRFGYFEDKASAVAALTRFEQNQFGSGFVTRIRGH